MEPQKTQNCQSNPKEKTKLEVSCFLISAYTTKLQQSYWHKNRYIDQWDRSEPRNKPTLLWSINLNERDKNI